jgi:hypothetical protein
MPHEGTDWRMRFLFPFEDFKPLLNTEPTYLWKDEYHQRNSPDFGRPRIDNVKEFHNQSSGQYLSGVDLLWTAPATTAKYSETETDAHKSAHRTLAVLTSCLEIRKLLRYNDRSGLDYVLVQLQLIDETDRYTGFYPKLDDITAECRTAEADFNDSLNGPPIDSN